MADLIQKLEALYDEKMQSAGETTRAQALYDRILTNINSVISAGNTFDVDGFIKVYSITVETNLLLDETGDVQHKDLDRLTFCKNNKSYLEWYFNKQLNTSGYKFTITIDCVHSNSLLNKKTKTTLNILLHRQR
jgi:hypothetical protein